MSPSKRYSTRSSVQKNVEAMGTSSSSSIGGISKVRKLIKRDKYRSDGNGKHGVLTDSTNSSSSHRMNLRSKTKPGLESPNSKKRLLSSECDVGGDGSILSSSSFSSSFEEQYTREHSSILQSPESPTKKRSIQLDDNVVESMSEEVALPPRRLDFSLFMSCDGNGDILREILSYFFSPFHPTGNEAMDLLCDKLNLFEILHSFFTCKAFAVAIEKTLKYVLLPSVNISFNKLSATVKPSKSPFVNLFQFITIPERRIRSFTPMDARGKKALDDLFVNPVFCVRYRGIRQGNKVHSAFESTASHWPLQLHTFFKMRTYTRFDRLMNVYAQRSFLPLPWLDFQITDRFYNKKKKPILKKGKTIKSSHSLWTIGMEPKLQGDTAPEEPEAMNDEDPDIWVDSYLNCAEDECFVYIRDCRRIANMAPLRISWPTRCEEGAHEGPLKGDGSEGGAQGQCGRFVQGDSQSHAPTSLNINEPGQPVRPQYPGWMFRVKQETSLAPMMERVRWEVKTALYRSEDVDTSRPIEFHNIAVTTFGNERFRVVDEEETVGEVTSRTIFGDDFPTVQNVPLHVLELRDVVTEDPAVEVMAIDTEDDTN